MSFEKLTNIEKKRKQWWANKGIFCTRYTNHNITFIPGILRHVK